MFFMLLVFSLLSRGGICFILLTFVMEIMHINHQCLNQDFISSTLLPLIPPLYYTGTVLSVELTVTNTATTSVASFKFNPDETFEFSVSEVE